MSIGLRLLLVTLLFISVFAGIIILQYPQKQYMVLAFGDCSLQGNISDDLSVEETLFVYLDGMKMQFSPHTPLRYRNSSGKEFSALPKKIRKVQDGADIVFSNDAVLSIRQKPGSSYYFSFDFPEDVSAVSADYKLVKGARLLADVRGTRYGSKDQFWTIEGAAALRSYVSWRISGGKILPMNISRVYSTGNESVLEFLAQNAVTDETWTQNLRYWQDQVFAGLSALRYNDAAFQWKNEEGASQFNELAFITLTAELLARNEFDKAYSAIARAKAEYPGRLTWLSSVYTGKIITQNSARFKADDALVDDIRKVVQAGDESILFRADTIRLLVDTESGNTLKAYLDLAKKATIKTQDLARIAALLGHYLDMAELFPSEDNPFAFVLEQIDAVLIPLVQKVDSLFFMETRQGQQDTTLVLRTARLLMRYGELSGKSAYTKIGRTLILSVLNFADNSGMLPANLQIDNGRVVPGTKLLAPETVYELFAVSPYYPVKLRFSSGNGGFIRVYTASPGFALEKTDFGIRFDSSWQEGYSHYVILEGVAPFDKIQLYGINYNMDPEFEIYNASGYYFMRNDKKLFVKMRHKKAQEDIRLYYGG